MINFALQVGSNDEGVEKVVEMDGKYAYMMESSSIQYLIERNCLVTQIGGNLDNKVIFKWICGCSLFYANST